MSDQQGSKGLIVALGIGLGLYAAYKLILEGKNPKTSATETVKEVKTVAEKITEPVKKLVKGSPEMREHMKALAQKRKGKKRGSYKKKGEDKLGRKHITGHKGHKTKRGLAQDQERKSKEDWEKEYRKK